MASGTTSRPESLLTNPAGGAPGAQTTTGCVRTPRKRYASSAFARESPQRRRHGPRGRPLTLPSMRGYPAPGGALVARIIRAPNNGRGVTRMATVEECERALHELAGKLAGGSGADVRGKMEDRSLSCELRDLKLTYGGHLRDGRLEDIRPVNDGRAQIRLSMTSDDLLALTQGTLNL